MGVLDRGHPTVPRGSSRATAHPLVWRATQSGGHPVSPDQTATDLQEAAHRVGGFIYAPLPSGGAILHVEGVAKPIHLRSSREAALWSHGYLAGHQHMRDTTRAALAAAEVAADAPC